ncbi:MAG: Hsp70 family protein [Deltaproteobacteria bacterium]|nr:Hsp70 family protein [Deltaproteobacteria bacterium]
MTVSCPSCAAPCRALDDACGACGASLARLVVKDGRQRIDRATTTVTAHVENHGVVAAAFVVRRIDARSFPPWLTLSPAGGWGTPVLDVGVVVPAGGSVPVQFVVDGTRLPRPGQSNRENPGRVVIPLVTSVIRYDEERSHAQRKVLAVELAMGGRAALHPQHARMRFVPVERLPGLRHVVVVENDGGHALKLTDVALSTEGLGVVTLAPQSLPIELPAGGRHEIVLQLQPVDVDAGPVAFRAELSCTFDDGAMRTATLEGTVGRGPAVVVVDVPVVHTGGRPRRTAITLKNPGQIPVRIEHVGINDDDDGPWLRLLDPLGPVLLAPGATHRVELVIEPEGRTGKALEQPWGEKTLSIVHDGWQPAEIDRRVDVVVTAELGRTRTLDEATLGVDFGTSNSSVSVFHGPSGTLHALPLDRESGREALASLLFFTGASSSSSVDGFLFGAAAENAAPQNFTNLVRQLKSVVARAPDTEWNFVDEGTAVGSPVRVQKRSTPELLARLFVEIKRRSEDGLRALPLAFLAELGLIDTGVRFRHAVFSHPVGVDDAMIRALHTAARDALMADDFPQFANFKTERCVDEALAATLAWVYLAASLPATEVPLVDDERILCFDAGGGTCDVAAVHVKGLKRFRLDPGQGDVEVTLLANGGDPRFGGTDVDRALATWLLKELAGRPEGAVVDVDALSRALFYPSYEAWRRARGEAPTGEQARSARAIFHKASDVLRAAERIKKTLSDDPQALWVASLEDWPGRSPKGRVEVTLTREGFEKLLREPFEKAAALVDPVVDAAGWVMADVTTVLFTGQTSKIPALRKAVLARIMNSRGVTPPPFVVEPGRVPAFDVKRCVAQGAAILGDSKRGGGGWLKVKRRSQTALSSSLQVRRGPLLVDVKGLEAGAPLPAKATLTFSDPVNRLVLYQTGAPAFEAMCPDGGSALEVSVEVVSEGKILVGFSSTIVEARRTG